MPHVWSAPQLDELPLPYVPRVSGRVASVFVVSAACGEAILPALIALAYALDYSSFPRILVGASLMQLVVWAVARAAARRLQQGGEEAKDGGT